LLQATKDETQMLANMHFGFSITGSMRRRLPAGRELPIKAIRTLINPAALLAISSF
jgi:hypothetical protein